MVVAIIGAAIVGAFLFRWLGHSDFLTLYQNFLSQTDMLAIGSALAIWFQIRSRCSSAQKRWVDIAITAAGSVAAILFVALVIWLHPTLQNGPRVFFSFALLGLPLISVVGVSSLAWILRHAGGANPICRVLRLPFAVWIGRRSYMLYLVHLPIYWVIYPVFIAAHLRYVLWVTAICSLAVSLVVIALSWELLESPRRSTEGGKSPAAA